MVTFQSVKALLIAGCCLFLWPLGSCHRVLLPIPVPTNNPKLPAGAVRTEIPTYPNGRFYAFYKFAKQKQQQLKLSVPEKGFDSLQVRLWFTYPAGLRQFGELVELRFGPGGQGSATYKQLSIFFNPSREYENITAVESSTPTPRHGWASLADTLRACRIATLPDLEQLPQYLTQVGEGSSYGNDLLTVAVEVATPRRYRFYQYNDFERFTRIGEVNKLYRFVKYLRTELAMKEINAEWYGTRH